jgi:peroxidase
VFAAYSWLYSPDISTLSQQRSGITSPGHIRTDFFRNATFQPVFNTGKWLLGGQDQINKTPTLHAFFHLFATYHNTIADQYAADHPDWNDETLFQEARAWTIGVYQKMATREYLAATAGRPLPAYTDSTGRTSYNPAVSPNIDTFFASAAFRYGHAVTTSTLPRLGDDLTEIKQGSLLVRDSLFNPTTYYIEDHNHGIFNDSGVMKASPHASVFRGCANALAGKAEASIVDDLRNFMFGGPSNPTSSADLASLNIQRGRDHGIRTSAHRTDKLWPC